MDCRIWLFALFSLCIFSGISASSGGGQWCVAKQGASESDLQSALNYACNQGGADCSQILPGANCYEPNTLLDHASYAFNDYYQKNPIPTSCVFGGVATLTSNDPSNGNCHYASSGSSSQSPPTPGGNPPNPSDFIFAPPGTMTPPGYDSATSALLSLSLLFACLLVSLQVAN
ncbi:hypothetical protein P8452_39317 [Trifolium repens]|nr:hypothetical protein P8452_39317 [Trifolium repens]